MSGCLSAVSPVFLPLNFSSSKFFSPSSSPLHAERIFDGKYGSSLEQNLEDESDEIEERQDRVELAMQQWSQAEVKQCCQVENI